MISEKKRKTLEQLGFFDADYSTVTYSLPSLDQLDAASDADLIISKISDCSSPEKLEAIAQMTSTIPHMTSMESQRMVADRWSMYQRLDESGIPIPETRLIQSNNDICPLSFPVILKTRVACGPSHSHLMMIATSNQHVEQFLIHPEIGFSNEVAVAQSYLQHEKFLKIFVIDGNIFIFERRIKMDAELGELFRPTVVVDGEDNVEIYESHPQHEQLSQMALKIQNIFHLNLFGFDVICLDNNVFVVDVNYFPTYAELGGKRLRQLIDAYCRKLVSRHC